MPTFDIDAWLAANRRYREIAVYGTIPMATPGGEVTGGDFPTYAARVLACLAEIWPDSPIGRLDASRLSAFSATRYMPLVAAGQIVKDPDKYLTAPPTET